MADLSYRYATALMDLAVESGKLDEYYAQAVFLYDTFIDSECQRIITHPHISSRDKQNFFDSALKGNINEDFLGFLYLITDKNREDYLMGTLALFIDMIKRYKNQTTAYITSAVPLDDNQKKALTAMLSKKTKKQVEIVTKVDPGLIGGLYIYVDGYLIDQTIKRQLREMKINIG